MGEVVHAAKNFKVMVMGPDALCVWFMQLLNFSQISGLQMGMPMPDGSTRCTMLTNGGPLSVYVKDGKILRTLQRHGTKCFSAKELDELRHRQAGLKLDAIHSHDVTPKIERWVQIKPTQAHQVSLAEDCC